MSYFDTEELLSNFLHAAVAIPFAIPAFLVTAHLVSHLV